MSSSEMLLVTFYVLQEFRKCVKIYLIENADAKNRIKTSSKTNVFARMQAMIHSRSTHSFWQVTQIQKM
jgi:hypothetical protein